MEEIGKLKQKQVDANGPEQEEKPSVEQNVNQLELIQMINQQRKELKKEKEKDMDLILKETLRKVEIINTIISQRPDLKKNPQAINMLKSLQNASMYTVEKLQVANEKFQAKKIVNKWIEQATNSKASWINRKVNEKKPKFETPTTKNFNKEDLVRELKELKECIIKIVPKEDNPKIEDVKPILQGIDELLSFLRTKEKNNEQKTTETKSYEPKPCETTPQATITVQTVEKIEIKRANEPKTNSFTRQEEERAKENKSNKSVI